MRYWVRVDREIRGPYTLEELAAQGAQDATPVCPEGRPRSRRENWLPLRKAKQPPRFYARAGGRLRGPLAAPELERLAGFCGDTLVCPERRNYRNRWNWAPARTFAALHPAGPEQPPARAPEAPAWGRWLAGFKAHWRRPPATPAIAAAAALIFGVLAWMRFSYLPRVRQTYLRVHASTDLAALALLQERYRRETGAYADDFASLAAAVGSAHLTENLAEDLDLDTLLVRGTSNHFWLEANALDEKRTLIRIKASARVPKKDKAASAKAP